MRPISRTHQTEPWQPNQTGRRQREEAIVLVEQHLARASESGLQTIPDYVELVFTEDNIPHDAYACYFWIGEQHEDEWFTWNDCLHDRTRKIPIRIRSTVLDSDEAIVAVIAHELYEVVRLREAFNERGGLTAREIYQFIGYTVLGNLHYQAVAFGDRLVQAMRSQ